MKTLKWILIGAAIALLTVTAVAGSLGDVSADDKHLAVVQTELERDGNGLRPVAEERELLPVVEGTLKKETVQLKHSFTLTDNENNNLTVDFSAQEELFTGENVVDHIVFVTNTGNLPGHVRTWFAFELGELTEEEFLASIRLSKDTENWQWDNFRYGVQIDGHKYAVICARYKEQLQPGQSTQPSLLQIMMESDVQWETIHRMDGNRDGLYEVHAYSQVISHDVAWIAVNGPWEQG